MVTEQGAGLHAVDSATLRTEPGVVVHVRPGQVQQWHADQGFCARVVGIRPDVVPAGLGESTDAPVAVPLGESRTVVEALARELDRVTKLEGTDPLCVALALALLHEASPAAATGARVTSAPHELRRRFLGLVDRDHAAERSVGHYAQALGVSPRTLTRTVRSLDDTSNFATFMHRCTGASPTALRRWRP